MSSCLHSPTRNSSWVENADEFYNGLRCRGFYRIGSRFTLTSSKQAPESYTSCLWAWDDITCKCSSLVLARKSKIHNVERAATKLLEQAASDVPTIGFNQAALAFLEKNKDLYPDSYARAQEICNVNKCLWMSMDDNHTVNNQQRQNQKNVCDALIGLIRGIGVLENSQ